MSKKKYIHNADVLGQERSPQFYSRYYIRNWSDSEVRKWYSDKRAIANKRLERLKKSEYAENSPALKFHPEGFKTVSEFRNMDEMRGAVGELAAFLAGERNSVSGLNRIKAETVETLKKSGYGFINSNNLKSFGKYMEMARTLMPGSWDVLTSSQVADAYYQMRRLRIRPADIAKNFNMWLDSQKSLKDKQPMRGEHSMQDYLKNGRKTRRSENEEKKQERSYTQQRHGTAGRGNRRMQKPGITRRKRGFRRR